MLYRQLMSLPPARSLLSSSERPMFEATEEIQRDARHSGEIEVAERSIIVLEAERHRRS
jgi:hypothetical protein